MPSTTVTSAAASRSTFHRAGGVLVDAVVELGQQPGLPETVQLTVVDPEPGQLGTGQETLLPRRRDRQLVVPLVRHAPSRGVRCRRGIQGVVDGHTSLRLEVEVDDVLGNRERLPVAEQSPTALRLLAANLLVGSLDHLGAEGPLPPALPVGVVCAGVRLVALVDHVVLLPQSRPERRPRGLTQTAVGVMRQMAELAERGVVRLLRGSAPSQGIRAIRPGWAKPGTKENIRAQRGPSWTGGRAGSREARGNGWVRRISRVYSTGFEPVRRGVTGSGGRMGPRWR